MIVIKEKPTKVEKHVVFKPQTWRLAIELEKPGYDLSRNEAIKILHQLISLGCPQDNCLTRLVQYYFKPEVRRLGKEGLKLLVKLLNFHDNQTSLFEKDINEIIKGIKGAYMSSLEEEINAIVSSQ